MVFCSSPNPLHVQLLLPNQPTKTLWLQSLSSYFACKPMGQLDGSADLDQVWLILVGLSCMCSAGGYLGAAWSRIISFIYVAAGCQWIIKGLALWGGLSHTSSGWLAIDHRDDWVICILSSSRVAWIPSHAHGS